MAHLIALNIDVTKISKDRLYEGKRGLYASIMIDIKDEPDQFGNEISVWENQTKEERDGGAKRNFLGTGKILWQGKAPKQKEKQGSDEERDLPF